MKTTKINEGFTCEKCRHVNPPAEKSCRNHCRNCLYSKHVDQDLPGDRLANCNGLMEPISIVQKSNKEKQITHECQKCGKHQTNIIAPDDDIDTIIKVMHRQNIDTPLP